MAQLGDLDRESEQLLFHVVRAVADATHAGDPYMTGHSSRVAAYCDKIAESLALPSARAAHALHRGGIPRRRVPLDARSTSSASPRCWPRMRWRRCRVHPVRGAEVFRAQPALAEIARAVRHHHERFDGSGYPEGLRGDEIPLFSRIILVAETYEAMTHHRPYRRALAADEATRRLRESAGSQLDPEIVKHFLAILGHEPSA